MCNLEVLLQYIQHSNTEDDVIEWIFLQVL